jgi:hypothetical protein
MGCFIIKTVLTDGVYYYENCGAYVALVTKDPLKAWDFSYTIEHFRHTYDYLEFEFAQFTLVCMQKMLDDDNKEIKLDYTKFRLKHITSLDPLEFENYDATRERLGFVRFYGTPIG